MKKLLFIAAMFLLSLNSFSQSSTYVSGYTRSSGTYVQGHYRTTPNYTRNDNYSTIGNVNPYTGSYGTKPGGLNSSYYSTSSYFSTPTYNMYYSVPTYSLPSYYSSSSLFTTLSPNSLYSLLNY